MHEKLDRPGGSMLLSSGVVWRHRDLEGFRAECPHGDASLQQLVIERLDEDIDWLERLGAPVLERDTGNDLTTGARFDTAGLTAALLRAAGDSASATRCAEFPATRRSCSRPGGSRPTASCCVPTSPTRPAS